jgi:acetyl esterase/lipase
MTKQGPIFVQYIVWIALVIPEVSFSDQNVQRDVVYGMLSGLALTMDVYSPDVSIRRGLILIPGSAWDGRTSNYTDWELKTGYPHTNELRTALVESGFVVFVPNHRMAPEYRFPAALEDVQRAVRFIRHKSSYYGIEKANIGAVGHSSGGYLCALVGVLDDSTSDQSSDPVQRESAKVQAVVSIDAPYDLSKASPFIMPFVVAYMGRRPPMDAQWLSTVLEGDYARASPVTHVSKDDAAFMIIHAIGDPNISSRQAKLMSEAASEQGLTIRTVLLSQDTHTPKLDHSAIANWLRLQLN